MATIQTRINLVDGVSPALRQMTRAMNVMLNVFERVTKASGNNQFGKHFQFARDEIAKATNAINNMGNAARDAANNSKKVVDENRKVKPLIDGSGRSQENWNRKIKETSSLTGKLWTNINRIRNAIGVWAGSKLIGGVLSLSDRLTMSTARLNLMNDGFHTTAQLQDMIYQSAMRSRAGYLDMAESVSKVAMQAGSLFKRNGKQDNAAIVQFMENYNKMAAISGASAQHVQAAMLQITQALSSGELRGDELRSVLENMPVVADYLAKEMGVARDQILDLGHDGKITAEILRNAVLNATDDLNEKMKKIPYTWAQVWTICKNAALKAFEPILRGINAILKSDRFKRFAAAVGNAINYAAGMVKNLWNLLSPVFAWIFDAIAGIFNFFQNNWSLIAPIVLGVATAFGILATKMALAWTWTKLTAIWTGILTGAKVVATFFTWAFTKATLAQAGAQWGLNEALYACPLMWIIMAIVAVIVLIYIVIAIINEVKGTAISATGVICGSVLWFGAVIWDVVAWVANFIMGTVLFLCALIVNILAWLFNVIVASIMSLAVIIANIGIGIWNIISGVCQAIVNAWTWCCDNIGIIFDNIGIWWTNMWADCYAFFCDFITKVLNKLSSLAEYVQPFAEVLGMDITGKLGKIKKGVSNAKDEIVSQKQEYKSLKAFKDVNWKSQDYLSVGDAWNKGYNSLGYLNLEKSFMTGFDVLGYLDPGKAYDKGYSFGDKVQKKVSGFFSGGDLEKLTKIGEVTDLAKGLDKGGYPNDVAKALDGGFDNPNYKNPALDKIAGNTDDIKKNTGDTAENTAGEDYSYLRKLAERQSIQRYTLTDLKVDMTNNNNIASSLDVKDFIGAIAKQLADAVVNNAEDAGIVYR